jgi:hypothetical protein
LAKDASAAAAPVEQYANVLDRRAAIAQKVVDQLRVATAARQEVARVGVLRPDLRAQPGRRQRQAVLGPRPA